MKKSVIGISMAVLTGWLMWGADQAREQKYQQAVDLFESKGDVKSALKLFEDVAKSPDRNLAARALLYVGTCDEKLGEEGARKAYERIVKEFGDQAEVTAKARGRLAVLGGMQQENGVVARKIWSGRDRRYYAVSPDGRYAVFTVELTTVARTHRGGTVYAHDLLSSEVRKILELDTLSTFTGALISPDGTQIAYITETPSARRVHIARVDGSGTRILFGTDGVYCDPGGWSADGKQLIASLFSPGKGTKVVRFSVADGSYKEIGTSETLAYLANHGLSPDGRYVVGYRRGDGLVVITLDGWREIPLDMGYDIVPVWTPDGARVLFQSDRRGPNDLWSIRVAHGVPEGPPELVRQDLGASPITFGVARNGDYYYRPGSDLGDLYVAEVDPQTGKLTSQPKQITDRYVNAAPAWSPDGESLVYYSQRSPGDWNKGAPLSVVVRSTKTGGERIFQKSELRLNWSKPQWFPDSRSLFIHSGRGKMIQLDTQTGSTQFLLNSESLAPYAGGNLYRPGVVMAPDGRSVFYILHEVDGKPPRAAMYSADRIRVIRRDLPDGPERELCRFDATTGFGPFPSPDGRRLAFWVNFRDRRSALMTISATGGTPTEVRTGRSFATDDEDLKPGQLMPRADSVAWSPAGHLFFVTQQPRDADSDEIWSVPADGGEAQPLGIRLHHLWSLDVSPDSKRLVFQDEQPKMEVWVLKNLFPTTKSSH